MDWLGRYQLSIDNRYREYEYITYAESSSPCMSEYMNTLGPYSNKPNSRLELSYDGIYYLGVL